MTEGEDSVMVRLESWTRDFTSASAKSNNAHYPSLVVMIRAL